MASVKYGFFRMLKSSLACDGFLDQIMSHFSPIEVHEDRDFIGCRIFYGTSPMFEAIEYGQVAKEYSVMYNTINGYDIFVGFKKVEV